MPQNNDADERIRGLENKFITLNVFNEGLMLGADSVRAENERLKQRLSYYDSALDTALESLDEIVSLQTENFVLKQQLEAQRAVNRGYWTGGRQLLAERDAALELLSEMCEDPHFYLGAYRERMRALLSPEEGGKRFQQRLDAHLEDPEVAEGYAEMDDYLSSHKKNEDGV